MTMKDPVRLLDGAGSEAERALLRAGASEEPGAEARQRLALALGLPGAGVARDTGGHVASGASTQVTTGVGASLATKWIVLTFGTIALGSAALVMSLSRTPAPHATRSATAPTAIPAPPSAATIALEPSPAPAVVATIAEPEPAAAQVGPESAARRRKTPAVAREIAQLDAVRARLAANEPDAALRALRGYGQEHPGGVLRQEAALLRIEAWIGKGDRARAQAAAASFLRDNPQSPHANRIRVLLDDAH
jgi:hypothetical protein